ncbi:MAG: hypothetical protein WC449_04885 [Candidatus Paceibacterota bacterium]
MIKKALGILALLITAACIWYILMRPTMHISQKCVNQCAALGQAASMETVNCYCSEKE